MFTSVEMLLIGHYIRLVARSWFTTAVEADVDAIVDSNVDHEVDAIVEAANEGSLKLLYFYVSQKPVSTK